MTQQCTIINVVFIVIRMGHIMCTRSLNPHLWSNFIFNQLPIGREQKKALRVLHGFSRKVGILHCILTNVLLLFYVDY